MKSLYKRELTMMVGIVALSFTLLSTAFMLLSYRYIISETRDRLERNAGYIAAATSDYLQNVDSLSLLDGIKWTLYQSTMETVSAVSEASVIVTDTQGEILYATDSGLYHRQIPDRVVQQILQQGGQHIHLFPGNGGEGQLLFMKLLGGFLQVQSVVTDALKVPDGL